MSRKGVHTRGKYISRSHTTTIGLSNDIALMLNKSGLITKVSLAFISASYGCKVRKLGIVFDQFGLQLTVQQPPARQELYVSAPDRDALVAYIETWCKDQGLSYTIRR